LLPKDLAAVAYRVESLNKREVGAYLEGLTVLSDLAD